MSRSYRGERSRAIARGLAKLTTLAGQFGRDTSGVVAVIFGLVLIVLVMCVGAAIDYSRASSARTEMQNACDAGVLAAMRQMQVDGPPASGGGGTLPNPGGTGSGTTGSGQTQGQVSNQLNGVQAYEDLANHVFLADLRSTAASYTPSFSLTVTEDGSTISGRGQFSAAVPLFFGGFFGVTTVTISNDCQSQIGRAKSVDFHFLVDTSMSMGLAATPLDRSNMINATITNPRLSNIDQNCNFACHEKRRDMNTTVKAYYQLSTLDVALQNHIKLRIDVEKDGMVAFIDALNGSKPNGARFRYSLATFNSKYRHILDATDQTSSIKGAIGNLSLGSPNALLGPGSDPAWTLTEDAFPAFATGLGTWMTANTDAMHFILLVTDGVHSRQNLTIKFNFAGKPEPTSPYRTFSRAECDSLKQTGATVGVIYTKYLEDTTNRFFNEEVAPYYDDIEPSLRDCASRPNLFAVGDSPAEIQTAFEEISQQALNVIYLSH